MKSKILYFLIIGLGIVSSSCETMKDPEVEYASTYPISGEYWVQYSHVDETGSNTFPFGEDFLTLDIYNTTSNNGAEVWITDNPNSDKSDDSNFWNYRVKVSCNPAASTFGLAPKDSVVNNIYGYGIHIGVYSGKIMKLASKQPSGTMTDSISFKMVFEDMGGPISAAGDTVMVRGFRKTGFLEDEH